MKNLMILMIMTITTLVNAQTAYDKGMQKAFEYWGKGENDKAIATFNRIAQVEKTNWIPYYLLLRSTSGYFKFIWRKRQYKKRTFDAKCFNSDRQFNENKS